MSEQYPDLGITQSQDGDYWDVVIPDLDCSTDYALQVAWIYSDKAFGTSEFSDRFNFRTPGPRRTCPINVVAVWNNETADLKVSWEKPFLEDNVTRDDRIRLFQLTLTAVGEEPIFVPFATKTGVSQYSYTLSQANNMANFGGVFQTTITGRITSIYGDGSSDDCPFTIPVYVDQVCVSSTSSPTVISADSGLIVSWQDPATKLGTYRETRVYVSESPSPYSWDLRYTGFGPASITLDTLQTVYVKLNHLSDSGCQSIDSPIVEGKAYDQIEFDDTPPENNFDLGTTTVQEDPNGLFNFDKKILFTWTQNTDTSTSGYRIRYKTASDANYTYMSVPGRATLSTYLYGLKAGQTYQIAVTTYDIYGNDNSTYKQYPNIVIPANTSLKTDVAISAGDMKLGYGIGGDNSNKGLYIAPENYWYVNGNTSVSSAARFKVGGSNDWLYWNGSNLEITGKINANAGAFTGSVDIGTSLVDGQLRVTTSSGKFEIGKLTNSSGEKIGVGIQGTDSVGKLFQLDTVNGIIANKGTIGGWSINDTSINNGNNIGFFNTTTSSDVAIWAGGSRTGTPGPNFSVTYGGSLIAKEATLYGSIEARSGYFGLYNATTKTITSGWKINGKFLESFTDQSTAVKVKLDGLQGTIAGGNIVGSNVFFWNPTNWYASNTGESSPDANSWNPETGSGTGNPGNIDYISSSGNFRLANGNLTYNGTDFKVKTDLVASNIFLGSTKSLGSSSSYLLGESATIGGITKAAGSFSLGDGSVVYDKGTNSFAINPNGLPYSQFKIRLSVTSNEDGYGGDTTVVQDKDGYLTTGRAFHYGGGNLPNGALTRDVGGTTVSFNPGDIWLSRI